METGAIPTEVLHVNEQALTNILITIMMQHGRRDSHRYAKNLARKVFREGRAAQCVSTPTQSPTRN
jgi:hypothetical protein